MSLVFLLIYKRNIIDVGLCFSKENLYKGITVLIP